MGELAPSSSSTKDEYNILVTGFDVFHDHKANPSWLIAQSLDRELPSRRIGESKINIVTRGKPLRVAYDYVREQLPPLLFRQRTAGGLQDLIRESASTIGVSDQTEDASLETGQDSTQSSSTRPYAPGTTSAPQPDQDPLFDLVLLIGMAAGRSYYTMETKAHRDGYYAADVDGKVMTDDTFWKKQGLPEILETGLDRGDVWRRWKDECTEDCRPSDDAGHYLCDFSFYTALAEYWQNKVRAPLTFLHVPGQADEVAVATGKKVAQGLLRAMAASEVARRK